MPFLDVEYVLLVFRMTIPLSFYFIHLIFLPTVLSLHPHLVTLTEYIPQLSVIPAGTLLATVNRKIYGIFFVLECARGEDEFRHDRKCTGEK